MKIIQSYWTKPSLKKKNVHDNDRSSGGWLDVKYHYLSWIFSCLQFKKIYGNVHLYTDDIGEYHLINLLKLPYTSVTNKLNDMDKYPHDLWAIGKLYTYSLQTEPFIHVDDDVYIWERFPEYIENGGIVAQNLESSFNYYEDILKAINKNFSHIPKYMKQEIENNNYLSCNAGIFGGNNVDFFKDYTKEAFDFIDKNYSNFDTVDVSMLNIIYEQYLFLAFAKNKNINVECLLEHVSAKYIGLGDFDSVPNERTYLHLVGEYKRTPVVCEKLEKQVMLNYPEYYERLITLLEQFKI